jgi:protein-disulfide isomerase
MSNKLKEKISSALAGSYYKKWYKRWWGIIIIFLIILLIIFVIYLTFLVVKDLNYFKQGKIYDKETAIWFTEDQFKMNQKDLADLMTDDDPWLGAEEPFVTIMAYESFGCPVCKDEQPEINKMISKFNPLVRFIVKDFPNEGMHENVFNAHLAANCANEQGKYWDYRDMLFENQDNFTKSNLKLLAEDLGLNEGEFKLCLDDEVYAKEIRQDFASGVELGVIGTPGYFINGTLISGSLTYEKWQGIIGYILNNL